MSKQACRITGIGMSKVSKGDHYDHRQRRRHLIIDHSQPCHTGTAISILNTPPSEMKTLFVRI